MVQLGMLAIRVIYERFSVSHKDFVKPGVNAVLLSASQVFDQHLKDNKHTLVESLGLCTNTTAKGIEVMDFLTTYSFQSIFFDVHCL